VTVGIFNINKPRGVTSFKVVKTVRRLTGVKKVGHAGTLDPIADGVLPVCVGQATRVVDHIVNQPKAYRATIKLGEATDSYDSEGTVTATGDPSSVTQAEIEAALPAFVGEIQQLPPMYSALKYQGQPLYAYARAGKTVERKPRTVRVSSLTLLAFEPPFVRVEMEVGRGAYVRTIAHDLGEKLGCHAHLQELTRTRSGPFFLEDAIGLEELERAAEHGELEEVLQPADLALEGWNAAILGAEHTREARSGRVLVLTPVSAGIAPELGSPCRAYSSKGDFLAVLRYRGSGRWHPENVFAAL